MDGPVRKKIGQGGRERMGNDEGWEKGEVKGGGEGDGTKLDWSSLDIGRIFLYFSLENLTVGRMGRILLKS